MIEALRRFINQRSGIDFRNYSGGDWKASRKAFMGDYRPMIKHGKQARQMLREVELRESITVQNLLDASRAFSGRLQFREDDKGNVTVDYTTGQYFPTEYRSAACAVLAQCLLDYWRECAPTAGLPDSNPHVAQGVVDVGEYITKQARRELGRGIARDWFN